MILYYACQYGRLEIIKYLVTDVKLNPTPTSQTMIHAAEFGAINIVKYLYEIGTLFTSYALKIATDKEVIKFLKSVTTFKHRVYGLFWYYKYTS